MATENAQVTPERFVQISDDDHLQLCVHLGRIKAIADSVCTVDRAEYTDGLFPHTLENLMETIDSEVNTANELLRGES